MSTQATDIQSILAALASQRAAPPSAPAPGQSPAPPPGYAPPQHSDQQQPGTSYPPQAHYGAPSGYGVPPPATTGAVDLSSIQPVNSGTVSIADAIAKAKMYAAEAAAPDLPLHVVRCIVTTSTPTGTSDGRTAAVTMAISGGGGGGRSFSPEGRGGRNGAAAHRSSAGRDARGGSPPNARGGDDNSETIHIEASLVGLIIGRQGENLRRIEGETGCRVQFLGSPEGNPSMRQCKISGPRARRADVKEAIDRIIRDTGVSSHRNVPERPPKDQRGGAAALREGEDHVQIMVPDPTVGLIIGRGGETIRDLQERSGCHINIVGETKSMNGLRPVNLIGTPEAAQKAKDFIMEIVDSDSRGEGGAVRKGLPGKGDAPPYDDRRGGGTPNAMYGGGMHGSGMHGGGMHGGGGGGHGGDGKVHDTIRVPSEAVGMIIGKRGDTIREIQNITGCKINVAQSSGDGEVEREIALIGTPDSISQAKQAIDEKIDAVRSKGSGPPPRGGGGGGRGGGDYGYGQPAAAAPSAPSAPAQPTQEPGAADPYAQYGGYNNYVALWYQQWVGAAAGQQASGDAPPQPAPGPQ
ncbi:related to P element somatic inhibitor [Cephalotrichum gorgonifer]|uniref:Related to P element somatic inhibitor n=1 Tax=Cephalotrichum gorgonifer TaxID=2041049 RepID=A0AAE8N4E7_9PEZI|nr:related to P element somatic inhibitor [Cephalotrichum gorgonifer]